MIPQNIVFSRVSFCILIIAMLSLAITSSTLAKEKSCKQTTQAAYKACQFEAKDDLWIAKGKCYNLPGSSDRKDCEADAKEAQAEGLEECKDQKEARTEVCEALGEAPYDPEVNPANFVDPLEIGDTVMPNQYFPLKPGTIWKYEGGDETITVTVTNETKEIVGVTCIVVKDVVQEDGEVIEDTDDWYAQDTAGNVWYFGEIARNYEDGELVDIEGSWKAGVDDAKPGIIMKANPQVGDVYRQEFALGDAEDMGEILSLTGTETVPAASCSGNCLVTKDYSPLEPDAVENKYYAPNIGLILEVNPETLERVELVEITTP